MIQPIGHFRLWRALFNKPIWLNSTLEQQVILMTLMAMANFKANQWEWEGQQFNLKPGQFITSSESIIKCSGGNVSIQNVRTALKRFEKLGFLTNESTKQGRLITLVNWRDYQYVEGEDNQASNRGVTESQPRGNRELTTIEEGKKVKKVKNIYAEFVKMTEEEHEKLINEYGEVFTKMMVDRLDDYKASTGKVYKDDYRTILNWIKKDKEKNPDISTSYEDIEDENPFNNGR